MHKSLKDGLIQALEKSITDFYGPDIGNSPDFSRIINAKHYQRLKGMLKGEEILFGGTYNDAENHLSHTLVNEPDLNSKLIEGEIFGPILPIISCQNESDIEKYINTYGKPLATYYVFSSNKNFQDHIIETYSFGDGDIKDTAVHFQIHSYLLEKWAAVEWGLSRKTYF